MAKTIDYLSATILIFMLSFVWTSLAFKNFVVAICLTTVFTLLAVVTIHHFLKTRHKPYTYDRLEFEFCLQGNEYVINLLKDALQNDNFEYGANYILFDDGVIVSAYKFSTLNLSDVCAICNLANKLGKGNVFVLAKGIDRRAYQVAQIKNIKVNIVKTKEVFNFLKKHDCLPNLKKVKNKFSLAGLVSTALSRTNFKSYTFSGVVLVLTSFITPLKIYYIVFGSISILLALLTLTPLGNGNIFSAKAFDLLEKSRDIQSKQECLDDKDTTSK